MNHLYFVRHGLSELNVKGAWAGRTETPLTDEGRGQALLAGHEAKRLGIDTIVSSPMGRAVETAQIIAEHIKIPLEAIHINKLLIERDFGQLEGQPYAPDLNLDGFSDIETFDTVVERARLAARWLHTLNGERILIVSHGAFGRAMRTLYLPSVPVTTKFHNAEIVRFL